MSPHGAVLDAQRVRALFQELSDRLRARGVAAQLFVVGGAAMALAARWAFCRERDVIGEGLRRLAAADLSAS
ncbi:hypothetical protein GCM10027062_13870 [Nocardioides hungaricus]